MNDQQRTSKSGPNDAIPTGQGEVDSAILAAVRGIRFGSVEIVIHDSKVVQIESKEKIRLVPRQEHPKSHTKADR